MTPEYQETPEAASLRVRKWAFGRYRPENWKESAPAESKPLRMKPSPMPGDGPHHLNKTDKLGCPNPVGRPKKLRQFTTKKDGRYSSLTIRQILDSLKRGESFSEIARGAGISFSAVAQRITRSKDPKVKEEYAALLVCACGRSKNPSSIMCYACNAKQKADQQPC